MNFSEWKETELGLIPFEWRVEKIGEISEVMSGGTPSTKKEEYYGGEIPWITPKDLSGYTNKYIFTGERSITEEGLNNSSAKFLPKNSILFSSRAPIGYVAIAGVDLTTNQGFKNLVCDSKISDYNFMYYKMKSLKESFEHVAGGSTFKEVSAKVVKDFKIVLPPLKEQKAIADILSSLDDKIELNNQMNDTLEEIAQALFKRWFVDFEFPNEEGQPYKSSGGEMIESELGMIPKEFKIIELGNCLEKIVDNRGKTPPQSEKGISLIEGYNISMFNSFITKSTKKQKYVSLKTYNEWFRSGHPRKGDILCATVGTLPKWCFVGEKDKICIAQNIIALRSNENIISNFYLKHFMDTNYFIQTFNGRIVTTAQPSIKVGHMTTIRLYIPQRDIISMFDEVVIPIYEQIEYLNLQNESLELIRDSLLPKLMSGEIRVSDLEG